MLVDPTVPRDRYAFLEQAADDLVKCWVSIPKMVPNEQCFSIISDTIIPNQASVHIHKPARDVFSGLNIIKSEGRFGRLAAVHENLILLNVYYLLVDQSMLDGAQIQS